MEVESTKSHMLEASNWIGEPQSDPSQNPSDSHGSGLESQRVMPSVYPAPEWLRWLMALRGQGVCWEGCGEHS